MNRKADIDIPRAVMSAWKEDGKDRQLRRALTDEERQIVERRRNELYPFLAGFEGKVEKDRVALALSDMFGSFRSMRQSDEMVVAQIEAAMRVLAKYPAWAIEEACRSIHENGVWRKGAFDKQWPPSDAEIIEEVRQKRKFYGDQYDRAVWLLEAEVETEGVR